ncbi:hypothetical protein QJS10_CPB11g00231 [Acorus calamus]|uniref:RRM domain-containing protein n=1 Tax=Acorus calamus TaxID=4465 RepID=A0AAV9DU36_ACOCL|nr:hypothetical protein QJS10_CPB11g00231 [Acorus calamus]
MPPRVAKRSTAGPGTRKAAAARASRSATKREEPADVPVKVEEVQVEREVKVEEEEKVVVVNPPETVVEEVKQSKLEDNGILPTEDKKDVKEAYVEEDSGEHLELEENEPEYEPDYDDDKDIVHEDVQEEGAEAVEEVEEDDLGEEEVVEEEEVEEEGDMVDDELEDGGEDIEGEEDDEHMHEEHEAGEEEEHHQVVKEHRKRKEFEVFVGGLDKDATEDDLRKVFSEVGEVTEVRLMMNPQTKKNKGFAFLRFATVEQAKRAVSQLKSPVVNGKQCGVSPSQDSDTLFLGNICKTWTKEALKERLKHYGIENVEDASLVEDSNTEGMNRGFAFLEFASRSDAMGAYRRLQKRDVVFGVDRTAKVAFADSFIEPDDEIMAQVKTVFVDGLPPAWDEDRVKGYLKKFGVIEKIELARNMPSAKRRDFGFITFETHDAAVVCAEGINNAELGDGDNKVKVRARLSRPHQKGRGKRSVRGDHTIGRVIPRGGRGLWSREPPRRFPDRGLTRIVRSRGASVASRGYKRPISFRDRRPIVAASERVRPLPPAGRSYDRRPPVPAYPKSIPKDYSRRDELPSRSRAAIAEYGSRFVDERRLSYRDEYMSRGPGYSDAPARGAPRNSARRAYADETYGRRPERPPPAYREGRGRDYDSVAGSKRPYSSLDDIPPRYADVSVRQSRARIDYGVGGSAQYEDLYSDRLGRSHLGYSGSRSALSGEEPRGMYGSRQGMGYGGGSLSSSDVGGMYSPSFGSGYLSRGSDVGGSSYSSLYSGRSLSGSGYMGSGGSSSYY